MTEGVMDSLGIFEVKTHLSAIIDRVERGEEIVITRHGESVARIVPEKTKKTKKSVKDMTDKEFEDFFVRFKEMRKGSSLGGLSWKELRDEGRR
jgi:prevent-host-death family protein